MNQSNPWSVKGISHDARETAKDAARRSGMTIGQWLNAVIRESASDLEFAREAVAPNDSAGRRTRASSPQRPGSRSSDADIRRAAEVARQVADMHERLTTMSDQIDALTSGNHGVVATPAFSALETDVLDMADAVHALVQRVSRAEADSEVAWHGIENRLVQLQNQLDRMMRDRDDRAQMAARPAANFAALGPTFERGFEAPAAPPHPDTRHSVAEQIAMLRARLDEFGAAMPPPAPVYQAPAADPNAAAFAAITARLDALDQRLSQTAEEHEANDGANDEAADGAEVDSTDEASDTEGPEAGADTETTEERILQAVDAKIERLEGALGSIAAALDPDKLAARLSAEHAAITSVAVAEQEAALSQTTEGGFTDLKDAMAQISERQYALETTYGPDGLPSEIEQRLDALGARLDAALAERNPDPAALSAQLSELAAIIQQAADRSGPEIAALDARLVAITKRIDAALAERNAAANALDRRFQDLTRAIETQKPDLSPLAARLDAVAKKIDQGRPDVDGLDRRLSAISERIDTALSAKPQLPSVDTAAMLQLDARLQTIAARLDTALAGPAGHPTPELEDFDAKLNAIAERLDRSLARPDTVVTADPTILDSRLQAMADDIRRSVAETQPDLSAVDARLAHLSDELSRQIAEAPSNQGAIAEISQQLSDLNDRVEHARAAQTDPAAAAALERQVATLTERLNETGPQFATLSTVERSLGELFDRLEHVETSAVNAARQAAREAVLEATREAGTAPSNDAVVRALEAKVEDIRQSAEIADQKTRDTLGAVHTTLEEVVRRMKALEDTARQPLPAPAPMRPPAPAGLDGVPRDAEPGDPEALAELVDGQSDSDRKKRRFGLFRRKKTGADLGPEPTMPVDAPPPSLDGPADMDAPAAHVPLEPGSRRPLDQKPPRARIQKAVGGSPSDAMAAASDGGTPPAGDFIAAARRAAQAASARAEGQNASDEIHSEGDDTPRRSLADRAKRPLLYIVAGLFFLIGAVQLYSLLTAAPEEGDIILPPATTEQAPDAAPSSGSNEDAAPAVDGSADAGAGTTAARPQRTVRVIPQQGFSQSPFPALQGSDGAAPVGPVVTGGVSQVTAPETIDDIITASIDQSDPAQAVAGSATPDQELLDALPADRFPEKLRMAAASGDARAQFEVAARFTDGIGGARDQFQAAEWYARAAGAGLAAAQYRLGSLYEKGQGLQQDLSMAAVWYERGARQGNRKAMHNLAVLHAEGLKGEPNFAEAARWFRAAAELGLADSQYNLAILHARGLGVEQNIAESYKWFANAATQGDTDAAAKRDDLAARMDADTLAAAKLGVQAWQPQPLIAAANEVTAPDGGWGEAEASGTVQFLTDKASVRKAQELLAKLGYEPGTADGVIGPRTVDAIRAFEAASGQTPTGALTPNLLDAMTGKAG